MTHTRTVRTAGIVATSMLALAAMLAPSAALASRPAPERTITGCHATSGDCRRAAIGLDELASSNPSTSPVVEPSPAPSEDPGTTADPAVPPDGEVSIDGPFITPTPSATPDGAVLGATGVPEVTPPPTDATAPEVATNGGGLQLLLLALAGLTSLVLIVGRVPAARRS